MEDGTVASGDAALRHSSSARSTVSTIAPSTTIEMRSHRRNSSSRSDDTTSDAGARLRGVVHHAVDFLARADVDADRRLVEQKELGPRVIPFGEHHFLLVAAGEKLHLRRRTGRLDGQLFHRRAA